MSAALRARWGRIALLLTLWPSVAFAQDTGTTIRGGDSVTVTAGAGYRAGGLYRFFFGQNYRDLWTMPVRVPVLDLHSFAGGLRPYKTGGGNQTKSLRFRTPEGVEYVFRCVAKAGVTLPLGLKGTVFETLARDQISAHHPAAAVVSARILAAARILHVTPTLVVMPDDPLLGEFRADFTGQLGMIEEYPSAPDDGVGFAGAVEVIASDELLKLLDSDPAERVDAHALLAARLLDMMLNDWDRHAGQWKWARMRRSPPSPWVPIPRDRDKDFISYGGVIPGLARLASPNLMSFKDSYPSVRGLTWNSLEFDRRLLGGLELSVWDSVVGVLVQRVTDAVIDDAVQALPQEYRATAPALARRLKRRRDGLPGAAHRFYRYIAEVADIHATDAADRVTVRRLAHRIVDVRLESGAATPTFRRRFDGGETREIRVYLHGGDDIAVITGDVQQSIPVVIIGGNGTYRLIDSSRVDGHAHQARLYESGHGGKFGYGPDTLYNRRPWIWEQGVLVAPGPDRGSRIAPSMGLGVSDLGVTFGLGISRDGYGFGRRPYANRVGVEARYASISDGFSIGMNADHRMERSPLHFTVRLRMSQLELSNFHGYGNATPGAMADFFAARQRQWLLQPAVVLDHGPRSSVSLGPVIQYSTTDSTPNRFIAANRPYGFGRFGQAGLQLRLHHDRRDQPRNPGRGVLVDLSGVVFPAVWDVKSTFGVMTGDARAYLTLPLPTRPILALRAGAQKVYGTYPFHEAAFLGGDSTVRTLERQRYAGDASLAGSAELRLPLARFPLIIPFDVGVFGFVDAGRVYVHGDSPGGWRRAAGGGLWVGFLDPSAAISVTLTNSAGRTGMLIRTGMTF